MTTSIVKSKCVTHTISDDELVKEIAYLKSLRTDKDIRSENRDLQAEIAKLRANSVIDQQTIDRLIIEKSETVSNTLKDTKVHVPIEDVVKNKTKPISTEAFIKKMFGKLPKKIRDSIAAQQANGLPPSFTEISIKQTSNSLIEITSQLNDKENKTICDAFLKIVAYQQAIYEKVIAESISKSQRDFQNRLLKREQELIEKQKKLEIDGVTIPDKLLGQGFTKPEIRQINGCLHPDKLSSITTQKLDKAFKIFNRVFK